MTAPTPPVCGQCHQPHGVTVPDAALRARLTDAARVEWDALPEQSKAAYRLADRLARDEADLIMAGGPHTPVPQGTRQGRWTR